MVVVVVGLLKYLFNYLQQRRVILFVKLVAVGTKLLLYMFVLQCGKEISDHREAEIGLFNRCALLFNILFPSRCNCLVHRLYVKWLSSQLTCRSNITHLIQSSYSLMKHSRPILLMKMIKLSQKHFKFMEQDGSDC